MGGLFDFMLPELESPMTGASTDAVMGFIHLVSFILLIGITIALIYFAIKYKRKSEDDETPLITHNNTLEITWSVIPLILVFIVFGWGYKGWLTLQSPPDDAYEIHVSAFKWGWTFGYDTGAQVSNEVHVPAGRPVKLVMQSEDVIHSFYVPDYRIKQDVLPSRYTSVWFQAEEPGESQVFCTEYCGTSHSDMLAKVIVHEPEDFKIWLAKQGSGGGTPIERGENLVGIHGCTSCHSIDGSDKIGPTLKGLFGKEEQLADGATITVDENYIRESILEPKAKIVAGFENQVMTSFEGRVSDEEISDIIEYIKTLE